MSARTLPAVLTDRRRRCGPDTAHLFFSDDSLARGQHQARIDQEEAKRICRDCPVRMACAVWALDNGERSGIWAGYDMSSAKERSKAVAATGWKPGRQELTPQELRARREAERVAAAERLEATIREMWERGLPDLAIGLSAGIHPGAVGRIRQRLGLPTLFGPGGKRLDRQELVA